MIDIINNLPQPRATKAATSWMDLFYGYVRELANRDQRSCADILKEIVACSLTSDQLREKFRLDPFGTPVGAPNQLTVWTKDQVITSIPGDPTRFVAAERHPTVADLAEAEEISQLLRRDYVNWMFS